MTNVSERSWCNPSDFLKSCLTMCSRSIHSTTHSSVQNSTSSPYLCSPTRPRKCLRRPCAKLSLTVVCEYPYRPSKLACDIVLNGVASNGELEVTSPSGSVHAKASSRTLAKQSVVKKAVCRSIGGSVVQSCSMSNDDGVTFWDGSALRESAVACFLRKSGKVPTDASGRMGM